VQDGNETHFIPPCIPDSHPHRITSTKCCINTVVSPDDGHIVSRNVEIYKYTKNILCTKLVLFTRRVYFLFDFGDIVHQEFVSLGQMVKQHYYQ
jgi:hypothetical protein